MTEPTEQVQAYMRVAEQQIGAAFVGDGLYCHMAGAWQGPHTLTFALRLYEPRQANINRALKLAGAIEARIGASPVRVYSDTGVIFCEIPSPWPVTVGGPTLHGQRLAVPLGVTPRKTIAGLDFATRPHLLAVGPTRRGKTTALRALAFHLARQNPLGRLGLVAITFKPVDWQAFGALAACWAVITDPAEAAQALTWARDAMHERARRQVRLPDLFLFVDDLANLLAVCPDVAQTLAELASLGGGCGLHLVIGTQRLGEKGAGDALVTSNIPDRLVFGTASASDAAFYTGRGQTGAEKLGAHIGDALLVTDGGAQRLAVGYVSDTDLAGLKQGAGAVRPWLRGGALAGVPVQAGAQGGNGAQNGGQAGSTPVQTVQELPAGLLTRPPTAEDAAALRALYAQTKRNKNAVFREVNVPKNPLRAEWLKQALGEVQA